jgi:hypothetical protein
MTAGYSGTPLVRKLGLKDGFRCRFEGLPESVHAEIMAGGLALDRGSAPPLDYVHIFSAARGEMALALARARGEIRPAGMIWASWPKKASKVPTDITEDRVRDLAFPLGLVDVKVCAVDAVWSGLKLVIRLGNR